MLIGDEKLKEGVNIIIKNSAGKFLLHFRDGKPDLKFPLLWSTFGGGLNPEEEPSGAIRELQEELATQTQTDDFEIKEYIVFNEIKEWIAYYKKSLNLSDIQELNEGAGLGFFTADEIKRLPLTPVRNKSGSRC